MLASPGIGSGLDINGIISKILAVEGQSIVSLDKKEATQQTQLTAFGTLKGALSSFQGNLATLTNPAKFTAITATIADTTLASASATSSATTGSHTIEIQSLAEAQKLKSANFTSTSTTIGSGTLTIQFGTYSGGTFTLNAEKAAQSITISPANSSLSGIRDAINSANAGVTASIVNDGSGNRLVIASKDTGLNNALKITAIDDDGNNTDNSGLSQLVYDASTGGTSNLSQTAAASNAELVIDGISISKSSNQITDALEGVTLNLLKANPGTSTTLNLTRDTSSIQGAISTFVKAYNDLNKTISDLTKYNPDTKQASILTGDSTIRSIQSQIRKILSDPLTDAGGGLNSLTQIGISFQIDGTLKFDSSKLTSVLSDPTKDVSTLFASIGKTSDSLVSFVKAGDDTENGSYALYISQLATQGKAAGSTTAALTINSGSNDELNLIIDGITANITLAAGTYTASSLAAEVQSRINGVSAIASAGTKVTVSESAGILTVTSNRYGSSSNVSIAGGTGMSDLFGTPTQTDGLDVAGTINGAAATGSGQTLTANDNELTVKITGGGTGSRGVIDFAHGFAAKLDNLIDGLLKDRMIDSRIDGINATIKDIGSQRESLQRRLEDTERRLRAQYTALDTMLASMSQTSSFLQQQLARLPGVDK